MTRKSRASKRRSQPDYVIYDLQIDGWDYNHNFGTQPSKDWLHEGPYRGSSTLTFYGAWVSPDVFRYPRGSTTLSSKKGMRSEPINPMPESIGFLSAGNGLMHGHLFLPVERFAELVTVASSGHLQVISLLGTPLRYRKGLVRSISLNTEIETDEEVG